MQEIHTPDLRVIRLCVVGDVCGKSSLISRFVSDSFPETHVPTNEVESVAVIEVLEVKVKLVIVEVGSAFRKSRRFNEIINSSHGFMIAYDINQPKALGEVESIFSTISQVRALDKATSDDMSSLPHCTIVATQTDTSDVDAHARCEEGKKLASYLGCGFEDSSAKTGHNVFKCFFAAVASIILGSCASSGEELLREGAVQEVSLFTVKHSILARLIPRPEICNLSLKDGSLTFQRSGLINRSIMIPLSSSICQEITDRRGDRYFSLTTHKGETYVFKGQTDEETEVWIRSIRRAMVHGNLFGGPLDRSVMPRSGGINLVVYKCIEYLVAKNGVKSEGIFRIPGSFDQIRNLRYTFEMERADVKILTVPDINTVAGTLKQYLRELPEPIIPPLLGQRLADCRTLPSTVMRLTSYAETLKLLAPVACETMKHILWFLYSVHRSRAINKMDSHNLAMVLGPNIFLGSLEDSGLLLLLPRFVSVLAELIEYYDLIFVQPRAPSVNSSPEVKSMRRKMNMQTLSGYSSDHSKAYPGTSPSAFSSTAIGLYITPDSAQDHCTQGLLPSLRSFESPI